MHGYPEVELIATRTGDCGCPEEDYLFDGLDLQVHYEPNGDADAYLYDGEWDAAFTINRPTVDQGREAVFARAREILAGAPEA